MISAGQLLAGYAAGVFPMAATAENPELHWFDPPRRGILPVGGVHASRSLRRQMLRGGWQASLDRCFDAVIDGCAARPTTWINLPLRRLYQQLHRMGAAHSLEVWEGETLIGGLFGITLGGVFVGESMFSARSGGSKAALVWLSGALKEGGFSLCDTQYLTPHLASLGGIEVSRARYRSLLAAALPLPARLPAELPTARALLAA